MPDCTAAHTTPPGQSAWQARLALKFANDCGTTRLLDKSHFGPLRVQKALYPEGTNPCHAIIVHPPGGVVGGDQLAIDVQVGAGAQAFLSTPGAAKWYKANGKVSRQQLRIALEAGAALEWLPQETIFFNHADVVLEQQIDMAADATYIGCEILCMGRRASGETFDAGKVSQRTRIRRGGKLLWWEQGALLGGQLASPLNLNRHSVCATLIAVGATVPAATLAALREELGPDAARSCGLTQMRGVLVARHLGDDSEAARHLMLTVWRHLRPQLLGRAAVVPRIWQT
ncbi:urease accessory protein UreD [Oxalobacteraceae bacterium]|nr:urease accessory protein UreD [Oxalobacteraceae bacterium]